MSPAPTTPQGLKEALLSDGALSPLDGMPAVVRTLSGTFSSPMPNLLAKGRDYLTEQMTPPFNSTASLQNVGKVPSWEKIYDNAALHNNSKLASNTSDGRLFKPLEAGSQRTCVITLVATALGSGVLALPYAFAHTGLVVGLVVLVVTGCASAVSLVILMLASRYTEVETYGALMALATGSDLIGVALDGCVAIYGFATLLALQIFMADFVPEIMAGCGFPRPSRTTGILAMAVLVAPLMLPQKVSALRYAASLAPFAILFIAGNVVLQAPALYAARPEDSELKMVVHEPLSVLQSMCIFVFSVMCHANAVPVVHMLDRPSVARIVKVATYADMCCTVLYLLIGVGGYMSFQGGVQSNFLAGYPRSASILVCRMMMAAVCFVGIPINSSNAVQALQKVITAAVRREVTPVVEDRPVFFAFLAMVLLSATTTAAVKCTNVALVISLVGGSLTTVQMFWLPAFVYWKLLYPTQPAGFRNVVMVVMISGGVAGFCSVLATIASMLA